MQKGKLLEEILEEINAILEEPDVPRAGDDEGVRGVRTARAVRTVQAPTPRPRRRSTVFKREEDFPPGWDEMNAELKRGWAKHFKRHGRRRYHHAVAPKVKWFSIYRLHKRGWCRADIQSLLGEQGIQNYEKS